jgi:hypothetical protein
MNQFFELSEGLCVPGRLRESARFRRPTAVLIAATTASSGLEDIMLKRSISNLLIGIFIFLLVESLFSNK